MQQWQAGDTLRVGVIGGALGSARVLSIDETQVQLAVGALDAAPPPPFDCLLLVALPRPKMLKRILVDATALGVKRICFINSWRVDKSYWSSPQLAPDALREKCLLGLAQAIDTRLPEISLHPRFRPFVEDELPALLAGRNALLAHPGAAPPCPAAPGGPLALAIGPEGGYTDFEAGLLAATGFRPVQAGTRILRVDTAVAALLGRLAPVADASN